MMANEVFETIRTVLAVREYEDRELPRDVVRRIVDAAHLTASSANGQPWHFVLVRERERLRELGSLVMTGAYAADAGAAVIVAYEKDRGSAVSDASRAIQSMILTAWAEGLGSNWTGFGGMETVRKRFGIPDSYDVLAVVPFGYPRRKLGLGRKNRKPFDQVVSSERFGTPLKT
jgi:nitroreductase